jgi:hypothetical protein
VHRRQTGCETHAASRARAVHKDARAHRRKGSGVPHQGEALLFFLFLFLSHHSLPPFDIQWHGFDASYDQWVAEKDCECPALIAAFEASVSKAVPKSTSPRSTRALRLEAFREARVRHLDESEIPTNGVGKRFDWRALVRKNTHVRKGRVSICKIFDASQPRLEDKRKKNMPPSTPPSSPRGGQWNTIPLGPPVPIQHKGTPSLPTIFEGRPVNHGGGGCVQKNTVVLARKEGGHMKRARSHATGRAKGLRKPFFKKKKIPIIRIDKNCIVDTPLSPGADRDLIRYLFSASQYVETCAEASAYASRVAKNFVQYV